MRRLYTSSILLDVSCQSLLSKYFSESGKLVRQVFEKVMTLAKDSTCLVCVVIDEIETLTTSRQKSMSANECTDALRVGAAVAIVMKTADQD